VNVNTGVEVYPSSGSNPSRIRYVDLEIDVVSPAQGETRIIDQHLLKRGVQRGFITKEMADIARMKAKAAYSSLAGDGADLKMIDEDMSETSSID
jgi:predicted RNA-binding protein associated with RNAse of E/G family